MQKIMIRNTKNPYIVGENFRIQRFTDTLYFAFDVQISSPLSDWNYYITRDCVYMTQTPLKQSPSSTGIIIVFHWINKSYDLYNPKCVHVSKKDYLRIIKFIKKLNIPERI